LPDVRPTRHQPFSADERIDDLLLRRHRGGDPHAREELVRRLTTRPGHYMPASLIDSQLATLERPEAEEYSLTLDSMLAPERLTDRVMDWLAASGGATERRSA